MCFKNDLSPEWSIPIPQRRITWLVWTVANTRENIVTCSNSSVIIRHQLTTQSTSIYVDWTATFNKHIYRALTQKENSAQYYSFNGHRQDLVSSTSLSFTWPRPGPIASWRARPFTSWGRAWPTLGWWRRFGPEKHKTKPCNTTAQAKACLSNKNKLQWNYTTYAQCSNWRSPLYSVNKSNSSQVKCWANHCYIHPSHTNTQM